VCRYAGDRRLFKARKGWIVEDREIPIVIAALSSAWDYRRSSGAGTGC
jgi:hypothetical protein